MSDEETQPKSRKPYPRRQAPAPEPKRIFTEAHHALFRPPQGQDWKPEKIERIYVARRNREGDWEEVTEWFPPDELSDLRALQERFGGGVYRLTAVRYDGTIYRRVETNRIAGPQKPLFHSEPDDEEDEAPIAVPAALHGGGLSDGTTLLGIFQVMMQESRSANERMMAMMQQNNQMMMQMHQSSTEVLVAALSGNKQDVAGMVSAIATAVKPAPGVAAPAADPLDQADKMLALAKKLTPPKEESIGEVVGAVAQGIGALGMMQSMQAAQKPAESPPASLPPNGSHGVAG